MRCLVLSLVKVSLQQAKLTAVTLKLLRYAMATALEARVFAWHEQFSLHQGNSSPLNASMFFLNFCFSSLMRGAFVVATKLNRT